MIEKNTAGKGRKPTTSPGKPERNAAHKKKYSPTKSPVKKQWSKEKGVTDDIQKKDPQFGKAYQKARSGSGNGVRPGTVADRQDSDGGPRQGPAAGGPTAASNDQVRPGKNSFKTYRKNHKKNKDDSLTKAGAAPGKRTIGTEGKDGRRNAGSQPAKSKGNPKRDAFSNRQSRPAKATPSKRDGGEKHFDHKEARETSTSRQHKKSGAKPAAGKHKTSKRAEPKARKTSGRSAGTRSSFKK